MICSKCKNKYPIANKKYNLCQSCNWKRLHPGEEKKIYELKRSPIKSTFSKINNKSKSLKKKESEYSKTAKEFKTKNPSCQVIGCFNDTSDVHHMKGRGKYLNDTRYFLAVCRKCHNKIEENPIWAKENGYSVSRLEKD